MLSTYSGGLFFFRFRGSPSSLTALLAILSKEALDLAADDFFFFFFLLRTKYLYGSDWN